MCLGAYRCALDSAVVAYASQSSAQGDSSKQAEGSSIIIRSWEPSMRAALCTFRCGAGTEFAPLVIANAAGRTSGGADAGVQHFLEQRLHEEP